MWALNVIATAIRGRAGFDYRGSSMRGGSGSKGWSGKGRSHELRRAGSPQALQRQASHFLPEASGRTPLSRHPDPSPGKPTLDLGFQTCNRINVWYVKPRHCGNLSQQSWKMNIVSILEQLRGGDFNSYRHRFRNAKIHHLLIIYFLLKFKFLCL